MSEVTREEFEALKEKVESLDGKLIAQVTTAPNNVEMGDEIPLSLFVRNTDPSKFLGKQWLNSLEDFIACLCANVYPMTGTQIYDDSAFIQLPGGEKIHPVDAQWQVIDAIKSGEEKTVKRFKLLWPSTAALGILLNRYAIYSRNDMHDSYKITKDWGKKPSDIFKSYVASVTGTPSGNTP